QAALQLQDALERGAVLRREVDVLEVARDLFAALFRRREAAGVAPLQHHLEHARLVRLAADDVRGYGRVTGDGTAVGGDGHPETVRGGGDRRRRRRRHELEAGATRDLHDQEAVHVTERLDLQAGGEPAKFLYLEEATGDGRRDDLLRLAPVACIDREVEVDGVAEQTVVSRNEVGEARRAREPALVVDRHRSSGQ